MNDQAKLDRISLDKLLSLLRQAKEGHEAALTELYNHFFEKIYRFIFYRVGHKEVAEDLTEEVFIKVFRGIKNLQETQAFEAWLYQIARNQVIDYYRSKKAVIPIEEVENTLEYETNIVDVVHLQSQQQVFIKLLKELTGEQQAVMRMKFLEDLDNDEIAAVLNKTEGAIRVIQHRAITKLKDLISKLGRD
jgi:RNA polymerase sigma-70 factor, ECF subfamily